MSKNQEVNLKMNIQSAIEVLQILDNSAAGYSQQYAPERIVRIREVISNLDKELDNVIQS